MNKISNLKAKIFIIPLFLVVLLPVIRPLFSSFVPGTADGLAHKFRLVVFEKSLTEGNIRPRWLGDQALGFGSPIFIFNYLLPYYAISAINFLGANINLSVQIYEAVTLVLSFIAMYLLVEKLWGKKAGLVAATIYTWAPYHLLTIYLYEGWGEFTAFVFPPLIGYLIVNLISSYESSPLKTQISKIKSQNHNSKIKSNKSLNFRVNFCTLNFALCTFFWFLFILSHNVSAIMFSPVFLLLGLIFGKCKIRPFMVILCAFSLAAILSAFFWLPAIILNQYTAYPKLIEREMAMRGSYFKSLATLLSVAVTTIQKGTAGYYDFTVGLPIIIVGLFGIFYLFISLFGQRKKLKLISNFQFPIILLLVFFVSLYLSNYSSNWLWEMIRVLRFIVYPFRFLFPATFAASLLAGFFARKNLLITVFFIILAVLAGRPYTRPYIDQFPFPDSYWREPQTVVYAPQTKKSMATAEFLPRWIDPKFLAEEEKQYLEKGKLPEKFVLPEGAGKILDSEIGVERMKVKLKLNKQKDVTINTFYFPNWQAFVDGKQTRIEKDREGRMVVSVPQGEHELRLVFGETKVEKIGKWMSIAGAPVLIVTFLAYYSLSVKLTHTGGGKRE